ncbi:hypothetical protein RIF29_24422 [Crotalaria pallida]|uniref:TIR domain-containing protein n=1 Tax=Crotalaria pallida TaxID=3830 RepID=A0AAN9HYW0_CROPI
MAMSETKYDVFLSFTGSDTRLRFTGHLYDALSRAGIHTFIDDKKLKAGEEINTTLHKSIQESKMAIVVFSQNYAHSTFCLDELEEIQKCHNNKTVFPIFYKVDPSDVRHQKNSYGEAMAKHESRFGVDSEKILKWRSALTKVANISGFHYRREGDEYEYELIQKIVKAVSIEVSPRRLYNNERIVGLNSQVEELKSIIEIESKNTTCFLGIHGTGGIGKTTLTKALYNSICDHFEGSCFLFNVRETSKEQIDGEKLLLQKLLTEVLKEGTVFLENVDDGIKRVKRMLGRKRVLIVLDDIDDIEQLKKLAGGHDWFGLGSRIIITTRDKHVLDAHKVEKEKIYEMKLLNDPDSKELFCHNAFRERSNPEPDYEEQSNRAIRYANGLPLALKVIGSHLIGKSLEEWKSALNKYEKSPHRDIQRILRISYDGLESNEQDIFLDIACFFKGQRLEYVKPILEACDFHPGDGIRVLVDKSLITVENNCLMMHDLIQNMGREIVKEEKPKEAGKRSRLWFHKDVLEVLVEDTGSSKIEGIMLDPPQIEEIEWIDSAFQKMKRLRLLIVRNTSFSSAPSYLPNQLRLLDWKDYPSQSFPSNFCPKKIVAFNLRGSPLVQPFQAFEHLTYMNVSNCYSITQIPNLSGAKSLRELKLNKCKELVSVDESIGFLPNLVYLCASRCSKLQSFVPKIYLPSLEHLSFSLCENLEYFPEIMRKMDKPLKICLTDTSIKVLPCSIGNLVGLESVQMECCYRLQYLPSSLFMLPNLVALNVEGCSGLPESFRRFEVSHSPAEHCPSLQTLRIGNACLSDEDLQVIVHNFPSLKELNVSWNSFVSFPASIKECIGLTSLDVSYCSNLEEIPELPSSVQKLNALHCDSLNAETLSIFFSQVRKEINGLEVIMPGTEIPEWFDHRDEEGLPVFEARGKFPVVAVAFVFDLECVPWQQTYAILQLFIGGKHVRCKQFQTFTVSNMHVLLLDLRVLFSEKEWEGLDALLHPHDWKKVHVTFDRARLTLRSWGVYVYKQETNMDHIQFSPTSSYYQHPRFYIDHEISEEDLFEGMTLLEMLKSYLSVLRCYEDKIVVPEFVKSQFAFQANWAKIVRRVEALSEAKGSGFILHEEDDKDREFIQRLIIAISSTHMKEEEVVDYLLQQV